MIVQHRKYVRRTCGSTRSSLSALAPLATVGSEAAETMYLCLRAKRPPRVSLLDCQRQRGLRARLDDRPKQSELLQAPLIENEPKALTGSHQKVKQSDAPSVYLGHVDQQTAGVMAGAKSFGSSEQNTVNQSSRLNEAGSTVRSADGVAGRGCWKKQIPPRNQVDRSCNMTPPRKRADFQRVVHDERAGRTFAGGNRK
jgi:hypothetical protein